MKNYFYSLIMIAFCSFLIVNPRFASAQAGSADNSNPFSQAKFVPDIALIVDFSAVGRNMKNAEYADLAVPGLLQARSLGEEVGPNANNGFNFNYAEMSLYSVVDPYFDLFAVFHLHREAFEIEEAYINTRRMPLGFKVKAGKFLSSFGRINEQHAHYWDFTDAPLIYSAFFGKERLNEIGARLTWLAPTSYYLMLGGEILAGENEASFGAEGFQDASGAHAIEDSEAPNLYVGYAKSSLEAKKLVALFGGSFAYGKTRMNDGVDQSPAENPEGFGEYGDTFIFGGDLTLKYLLGSYQYLSLQSEYLYRTMSGDLYDNSGGMVDLDKKQSGLYSQLVYRMSQCWRAGFRFDLLQKNTIKTDAAGENLPENLPRYTAMLEYNPTEFSRIRLQYSHDRSGYLDEGASQKINNELILQFNITIGAHGAHSF
jgi:hypothetical protein